MYTNESKIEQSLQINIDDSISGSVIDWINWVSAYIDRYTGTSFISANTVKYYDVQKSTSQLFIDDFTSLTSVQLLDTDGDIEDTLTETTDYWTYPLNSTPKNEIRLNPYGRYGSYPYLGSKKVKITGAFGVGTVVPSDIEMVATQMVGDIIRQVCGAAKGVKSEKVGEHSVTYESVGQYSIPYHSILDLYRCPTL
jgi:hypothetical protein